MSKNIRKTNIICTIGPASENRLEEMIAAGMNVCRVNFSHGGKEEQADKVELIKATRSRLGKSLGLLLDTQGPEIRLGKLTPEFEDGFKVEIGDKLDITNNDELGTNEFVSISYKNLYQDVKKGSTILIDDGSVGLEVIEIEGTTIKTFVKNTGVIKGRKSVNVPGAELKLPALKEKDINDILYGIEANFDFIAASFTRNKEDVMAIRSLLNENGGERIQIIAKIENQEGIDKIDEILEAADGVMIARGDLAVEIPFYTVPVYQKEIIAKANKLGKPVIVATQMLDSMMNNPLPTRAEVSDVANAVNDRTSAIMLSGEAAVGKYPIECVTAMVDISRQMESTMNYDLKVQMHAEDFVTLDEKVTFVAAKTAKDINADAIVAFTSTGKSVRELAGMGVETPIIAITTDEKTYNQLSIVWNVTPVLVEAKDTITNTVDFAISNLVTEGLLEKGNTIFVTGGRKFLGNTEDSRRIGGIAIV